MASRKVWTEEQKDLIGRVCRNCGSEENIEYYHVVPLCNGGHDVITNVVPLCHACHWLAHGGSDLTRYKRDNGRLNGKRPPKCSDEEAFAALDLLASGQIGNAECKKRMNLSKTTQPCVTSQYKKWRELHNIKSMRNDYDNIAVNSPMNMTPGYPVGQIHYNDGSVETIRFSGYELNSTVYTFRKAWGVPKKPCTLRRVFEIIETKEFRRMWSEKRKEFLEYASEEQGA